MEKIVFKLVAFVFAILITIQFIGFVLQTVLLNLHWIILAMIVCTLASSGWAAMKGGDRAAHARAGAALPWKLVFQVGKWCTSQVFNLIKGMA